MRIALAGSRHVAAPRERVWARLLDPRAVTGDTPAVESIEPAGPGRFTVTVAIGLGFFKLRAPLDVRQTDLTEPERGTLLVSGTAMGTTVNAKATFVLTDDGAGTRLDWTAEGEGEGRLAGMAGEALEPAVRKLVERFWDDFAAKVSAGG